MLVASFIWNTTKLSCFNFSGCFHSPNFPPFYNHCECVVGYKGAGMARAP